LNTITDSNRQNKIPFLQKVGYGAGNFTTGVSNQVLGTYLVFYCTAILGIPGKLVGLAVSISIVWDAVTDPIMGYLSDITRSKTFGRRHLYLLIGGVGLSLSNYYLWNIKSQYSDYLKFTIIFVLILVIKTFSTIYITPYTALGAELSDDYDERTSIQGMKTIFFLLGLAFVSVFGMYVLFRPSPQFPIGQLNPHSYKLMGLFSSIIIGVFSLLCFFSTKKYIPILNSNVKMNPQENFLSDIISSLKGIFLNKNFKNVAFSYMFINIASALITSTCLHVFTYTFSLHSQQIAIIIGVQFFVSIISQPVWAYLSRKMDKKPAMMSGIAICIFGVFLFLIMVLLKNHLSGNHLYFMPFALLAGFGTGGLFTLPLSMIADIIDSDELNTGTRAEGSYYGCLTLLYKLSQSITLLFIGYFLELVKFNPTLSQQSENTVIGLGLFMTTCSLASFIAALSSLMGYDLNSSKVKDIQKKISEKKKD